MVIYISINLLYKYYNYTTAQEVFIPTEGEVYVLNEPIIKKNKYNNDIILKTLVLDCKNNLIYTIVEGEGTKPKEEGKLIINGEE